MKKKAAAHAVRSPRQERARDTVAAIVDASRLALMKHGYAKTTTNHIAEIAGVSVGSLYQYFRNKDEILAAMIRDFAARMSARLRGAVLANVGKPLSEIIAATIDQIVDAFAAERDLVMVTRSEVPAKAGMLELDAAHREAIAGLAVLMRLVGGTRAGEDAELKAFIVFKAIDGVIFGWLTDEEERFGIDDLKRELTSVATKILV